MREKYLNLPHPIIQSIDVFRAGLEYQGAPLAQVNLDISSRFEERGITVHFPNTNHCSGMSEQGKLAAGAVGSDLSS
jgi:hypothetical protein